MKVFDATDVVVIGGGAVGCSIAYHLAKEGIDVILFERGNLASGASGRCGGMVVQLYGRELNIDKTRKRLNLTQLNTHRLLELQDKIGDFEYKQIGSFDIAVSEEEWNSLKKLVEIQHKLGDNEIELLDEKQTREIMPIFGDRTVFGSRYRPSDGNLNPFKLTYLLARAAKKHGAVICTNTKIEEIIEDNGKVIGVRSCIGKTKAKWVVNATNAWASQLTKEVEIIPVREIAMITEALPELRSCPFEARFEGEFAYGTTQTKDGNLLIGGPGLPTGEPGNYNYYDEFIRLSETKRCAEYLCGFFPSLRHVNVIRSWAGTMAFTPDGVPFIGPIPNKEGLLVVAGFADGMADAAAVGELITEYITQGKFISIPMEIFDPGRPCPKIEWPHPYVHETLHEFLAKKYNNLELANKRINQI